MIASQRCAFNKEGLGYNMFSNEKAYNMSHRPLVRANALHKKYRFCKYIGHSIDSCPIRNGKPYKVKWIWIPKGTLGTNS